MAVKKQILSRFHSGSLFSASYTVIAEGALPMALARSACVICRLCRIALLFIQRRSAGAAMKEFPLHKSAVRRIISSDKKESDEGHRGHGVNRQQLFLSWKVHLME